MSKLASKLSKRIMAAALSVAMVMSNMTVYASELTGPQAESSVDESVIETEEPSVTPDDAATSGVEAVTDEAADDATDNTVVEPAGDVTDEDGQTPETGKDAVTEPGDEKGTEDTSLENEEEVKSDTSEDIVGLGTDITYVLDANDLTAFGQGDVADGAEQITGTDRFYTLIYSAKTKIDTSANKTWGTETDDDYFTNVGTKEQRINFGGNAATNANAVKFTTVSAATVKVWWAAGDVNRQMQILDAQGTPKDTTAVEVVKNSTYVSQFTLTDAGTYYLGSSGGNNYIFKVAVTTSDYAAPTRKAWTGADSVADPALTAAVDENDAKKINVTVNSVIGSDGGDKLVVSMYKDTETTAAGEQTVVINGTEQTLTFTPTASGSYTFKAELSRDGETSKKSASSTAVAFSLPLAAPTGLNIENNTTSESSIAVAISWNEVKEATGYLVTVTEASEAADTDVSAAAETIPVCQKTVTGLNLTLSGTDGLKVGKTYTVSVAAVRAKGADDENPDISTAATGTVKVEVKSGTTTKKTHKFDATTDFACTADGTQIDVTYLNSDRYFKLEFTDVDDSEMADGKRHGTATVKSASGVLGLQLEKWESAAIEFEVKGTADVVITAMGTNASNKGPIALKNSNGVKQTSQENKDYAQGNTTLTYKGLPEGTYKILSPKDATENRGVRILTIEVTEEYEAEAAATTTTEYLFDVLELPTKDADGNDVTDDNPKTYLEEGKVYKNYFTVVGKQMVRYRTADAPTGRTIGVDLTKSGGGAIQFRVTGTADVELEVSSNGAANYSMIGLVQDAASSTDLIANEENIRFIKSMNRTKLTYKGLSSGIYYVVSPKPTQADIDAAVTDGDKDGKKMSRDTRLYTIKVTETKSSEDETPRAEWPSGVAAPEIKSVTTNSTDPSQLDIVVDAVVDYYTGGDKITLVMKDEKDNETTDSKAKEESSHTFTVKPTATGRYTFTAYLSRNGESDVINSKNSMTKDFVLPLDVPNITFFFNNGKSDGDSPKPKVRLDWQGVDEATSYLITVTNKATNANVLNEKEYTVEALGGKTSIDIEEGFEIGQTYVAKIKAKRAGFAIAAANTTTDYSEAKEVKVTGDVDTAWDFVIYGLHDGDVAEKNDYTTSTHQGKYNGKDVSLSCVNGKNEAKYEDAFLRMWSRDGSGKIQPTATDGLAFYYTTVNPAEKNFTLSALMHVNEWTLSNGQEGFGLMAADRIGTNGDKSEFYTNSYQALASKIEYRWNPDKAVADYSSNTDYPRYSMKLGIGSTEKRGITAANLDEFKTDTSAATAKYYKCDTKTLETYLVNDYDGGSYNIIGNYSAEAAGTVMNITDMKLTIELNNTGYYISCTPVTVAADGTVTEDKKNTYTNRYYKRDALSMIEDDKVYVGFFTSRNADVTFRDVKFATTDYDPNGPIDTQPIDYIEPSYDITSGSVANNEEYELLFGANWQGTVTIKDEEGNVIVGYDTDFTKKDNETFEEYATRTGRIEDTYDESTKEYKMMYNMVSKTVNIDIGTNTFYWTFTPDGTDAYNPDPELDDDGNIVRALTQLEDYTTKTGTFTVTYKAYGEEGTALYVSPKGSALGTGTKANPLDIYTAVKYAKPGQTIYLMKGTYNLAKTVTIDRGVDGTADKKIYLIPDPSLDKNERPVFDFSRSCEGIVLAGSYWYLSGFDVTKTKLGSDGMRVCGNYNVVDGMNFYNNGNTGLQISRYKGTDTWDYWPQYNLIRNCTSYLNADQGFEDADGFAAKLTVAEGNTFDGCIAAYNADDGWDLFAKPESGNIGTVVIKNSIAYRNGYVLIEDTDKDGKISAVEAGAMDRVISFDGIEYPAGNGNGFKLGGNSMPDKTGVGHTIENSFAFHNRAKGIDSNSGPNINVKHSVSFDNESYNVALYGKSALNTDFSADGVISYRTDDEYVLWKKVGTGYEIETDANKKPVTAKYNENGSTDDIELNGKQMEDMSAVYNSTSYYWDSVSKGAYTVDAAASQASAKDKNKTPAKLTDSGVFNTSGTKVEDTWFANVKGYEAFDAAFKADSSNVRKPGGTIKMEGFLELTDAVGEENKWEIKGEDSPVIEENNNVTDGSISSGNAGSESSSGVCPEDADKYNEKLTEAKGNSSLIGLWFNVVDSDEVCYTGKAVKPTVHVYDGTTLLTSRDYSIVYRNNINAWEDGRTDNLMNDKKPTIIVRGKGNYLGKANDETFEIHPVSLNEEKDIFNRISASDIALVSNNKEQAVKPKVTFNNRALSSARDKDYSFQVYKAKTTNNTETVSEDASESGFGEEITSKKVKDAASYVVKLTGHGNYTDTRVINLYVISQADKEKLASSFKVKMNFREKQREGYLDNYGKEPKPVILTTTSKNEKGEEVSGELDVRTKSGTLLIEGVDYTLSYTNNIEVGTATVTITGKSPNYFGTKLVGFRIAAPRINTLLTNNARATLKFYKQDANGTYTGSNGKKYADFDINARDLQIPYTGSAVTFSGLMIGTLPDSNNAISLLQIDKDYTLTYRNNNRAGTASVVVKGVGNYSGSVTRTFRINPLDLNSPGKDANGNDIKVNVIVGGSTKTVSYVKGGAKPTVTLRITANGKDNKMILGKDYTVTYRNHLINSVVGNTNANRKPSVIIRGRGALKGTLTETFSIDKKDLSDPNMTITAEDVRVSGRTVSGNSAAGSSPYTGRLTSRIIIKDTNGKVLSAGTDYDRDSITYELISGNGSIAGKGTVKADGTVDASRNAPTATIASDNDVLTIKVTVKAFNSSSNANKYAKCNYSGEISTTFRVGYARQSIASARVTVNYDRTTYGNGRYFYYNNGNEIKLFDNGRTGDLTVKVNNEELTYNRSGDESIDGYTIVLDPYSYVNNTKKGTARVTIRGTGKYTGTKVVTYRIGAREFNWWTKKDEGSGDNQDSSDNSGNEQGGGTESGSGTGTESGGGTASGSGTGTGGGTGSESGGGSNA